MKIAIIGAGNMGGSIAQGLSNGKLISTSDITVSDSDTAKLKLLKDANPDLQVTSNNIDAVETADIIIIAVKPWLVHSVLKDIDLSRKQILVSIAAGINFEQLAHDVIEPEMPMFRVIPNTAISELESFNAISSRNVTKEQESLILSIFNEMGTSILLPEDKLPAATALASCGIAFVFKYIQAAMQAGVEMGIRPDEAMNMVAQSVKGAAQLILNNHTHPSIEIDKVTTPGGITIKGINELDHAGFTSAVIKAMKACN